MATRLPDGRWLDDFGDVYEDRDQIPWTQSIDGMTQPYHPMAGDMDSAIAQVVKPMPGRWGDAETVTGMKGQHPTQTESSIQGTWVDQLADLLTSPFKWIAERLADLAFILLGLALIIIALVTTSSVKGAVSTVMAKGAG